ncbi:hypothetical protein ACFOGJ_03820 [Marinibaculum pumilum]|uniref:DUF805 domain-containing protein n=1 Tax=Marinibaculum pumilum TaxID=1766165 RepID=A0ABV7KVQ1_9PROT
MAFLGGVVGLALLVLTVIGAWRGLQKAGFSGAWSLLLLVPVVNLVMLWVFAFISWPVDDPTGRSVARTD